MAATLPPDFSEFLKLPDLFQKPDAIGRFGQIPMRIEVLSPIFGVSFDSCFDGRVEAAIDDVAVNVISLSDLKTNKRASGRLKDLADGHPPNGQGHPAAFLS